MCDFVPWLTTTYIYVCMGGCVLLIVYYYPFRKILPTINKPSRWRRQQRTCQPHVGSTNDTLHKHKKPNKKINVCINNELVDVLAGCLTNWVDWLCAARRPAWTKKWSGNNALFWLLTHLGTATVTIAATAMWPRLSVGTNSNKPPKQPTHYYLLACVCTYVCKPLSHGCARATLSLKFTHSWTRK